MKIFLDNCVPYRAKRLFSAHEVKHAQDAGLHRLQNGKLLQAAAAWAEVLVTTDKQIRHQQNLERLPLPILELNSHLTRFEDLQKLSPRLEDALKLTTKFLFVSVASDGEIESLIPRP